MSLVIRERSTPEHRTCPVSSHIIRVRIASPDHSSGHTYSCMLSVSLDRRRYSTVQDPPTRLGVASNEPTYRDVDLTMDMDVDWQDEDNRDVHTVICSRPAKRYQKSVGTH